MTPGLVAFFVVIAVLLACYAIFAPTNPTVAPENANNGDIIEKPTGLFDRWVRPAIRNFLPQTPVALTEYARKSDTVVSLLAKTGNPWKVSPEEFVGLRVLAIFFGGGLMVFLAVIDYFPLPPLFAMLAGGVFGYLLPKAFLDMRWSSRRRDLRATLPEALDLLQICMNAGATFPNALQQTVEMLPPGTTRDELGRTSAELNAGRSIKEALSTLVLRCPTDGIEAFTRAIIQANETGSDISETLAFQSAETRADWERVVETRAAKLQTTLFFPIILFLLPALLITLFGPSLSSLSQAL